MLAEDGRLPPFWGRWGIMSGFGRGGMFAGDGGRPPACGRGGTMFGFGMPVLADVNGLLPGRGPGGRGTGRCPVPAGCLGAGFGPCAVPCLAAGASGRWPPGLGIVPGPGFGPSEPGLGAAGFGCMAAGVGTAPGPGLGTGGRGAGLGFRAGADWVWGCSAFAAGACCWAGVTVWAAGGAGTAFFVGVVGAAALDSGLGWAFGPPFAAPLSAENASFSLRTTGASIVEDAERTNSPSSWSLAMTTLLSTPNSFASS